MTWRVLISAPYLLPVLEEFRSRLEAEGVEIVTPVVRERLNEVELLPLVETIDGAICGDDQYTERVFNAAPRLRVISKWGTGINSIDTVAAAKAGVRVFNTPDAFTDPVADTILGYILSFARRLPEMDRDIRQGFWKKLEATALRGSTLGVVGVGNIGKAVVRRAQAFGMIILGYDPVPVSSSFIEETGIKLVSLHTLLEKSDFVTLQCDLNASSFHLIGVAELQKMKSSAYIINTSRGPVIDEPALVEALREHRIAGAALDVFEVEPLPDDSPLRSLENCLLAPHNANSDPDCRRRVHESTIENLLNGLRQITL
jgi:D-3-phosphoglycerate dehydrogenase